MNIEMKNILIDLKNALESLVLKKIDKTAWIDASYGFFITRNAYAGNRDTSFSGLCTLVKYLHPSPTDSKRIIDFLLYNLKISECKEDYNTYSKLMDKVDQIVLLDNHPHYSPSSLLWWPGMYSYDEEVCKHNRQLRIDFLNRIIEKL